MGTGPVSECRERNRLPMEGVGSVHSPGILRILLLIDLWMRT